MDYRERLIPVAAEADRPREELTDEEETRIIQRDSEVRDSQSRGLSAESICNPSVWNGVASAVESQQSWSDIPSLGDPSPGEVTGGLAELGPGLTDMPSLSSVWMATRYQS